MHCRTTLSLSEQIQVSLKRTKMIPIQAGDLKHLLFAFKIQVEVQLHNWRSLCTELHPSIMCRFSHLLGKGWTVCQAKSILYQIRLNYNKRPVLYAWFVNRNIFFFFYHYLSSSLSQQFFSDMEETRSSLILSYVIYISPRLFSFSCYSLILLITFTYENMWTYIKKSLLCSFSKPSFDIPCCIWPLRLSNTACETILSHQ